MKKDVRGNEVNLKAILTVYFFKKFLANIKGYNLLILLTVDSTMNGFYL